MFSLTLTHLRFTVEALTPVRLSGYNAGSQLRGALGNMMQRAYILSDQPISSQSAINAARLGAWKVMPGAGLRLCLIPLRCASGTGVSGGSWR